MKFLATLGVLSALLASPALAQSSLDLVKHCVTMSAITGPGPAAGLLAAKDLVKNCNTPLAGGAGYLVCISYLGGVLDANRRVAETDCARFCAPALSPTERRKAFLDWAKGRRDLDKKSAVEAAEQAFIAAYPCRR